MQSTGSHAFCKDLLPRTNGNCLGPGQGFPEPMAIALTPGRASQNQWQLPWPRARPRRSSKGAGAVQPTLIPIEDSMGIRVSSTSPAPFILYLHRYNVKGAPFTLYLHRYNVKGAGDVQLILIPIECSWIPIEFQWIPMIFIDSGWTCHHRTY